MKLEEKKMFIKKKKNDSTWLTHQTHDLCHESVVTQ